MRPGRQEPSLSMLRRMAHSAGPEAIFKYLVEARRERDGLRDALVSKLSAQAAKLELGRDDILTLRWPAAPKPEVLEALEDLRVRLRQKHGWEGELLVLTGGTEARVLSLGPDDMMVLRYENGASDDQRAAAADYLSEHGLADRAVVVGGPADLSAAKPPEIRYDDRGRLDEVVADGARVRFFHLEYMDDDHVWLRIDLERPGAVATTRVSEGGERSREVAEGREAIVVNLYTGRGGDEARGEPVRGVAETE